MITLNKYNKNCKTKLNILKLVEICLYLSLQNSFFFLLVFELTGSTQHQRVEISFSNLEFGFRNLNHRRRVLRLPNLIIYLERLIDAVVVNI